MIGRALLGFLLIGVAAAAAKEPAPKVALHFERITGGIAEEGFDIACGKPSASQCEVVQLDHGQPQETATVPLAQAREWIAKFAAATKSLSPKRAGAVVLSVSYTLDGKAAHAELLTTDRKPGATANPLAHAFVALETRLRDTVAATP